MSGVDDLIEFVKARLREWRQAAEVCAEMFPPPWDVADRGWRVRIYASDVPEENFFSDDPDAVTTRNPVLMEVEPDRNIDDPRWLSERVEHVALHDPARVLREVEALRRIVEDCQPYVTRGTAVFTSDDGVADRTLRALAAVWADHKDYQEEWRA